MAQRPQKTTKTTPALPTSYQAGFRNGEPVTLDYLKATQDWYASWSDRPLSPIDWQRLLRLAPLIDLHHRKPDKGLLSEIRQQESLIEGGFRRHGRNPDSNAHTQVDAVERELKRIHEADSSLADSALAALALSLAREMDGPGGVQAKAACGKTLLDTLDRLRELAPAKRQEDAIDQLAKQRAKRRSRSAKAAGQQSS